METTFDYLRQFGPLLAERILETYPPLQSTKDPVAPALQTLLRNPFPAQALAISGTAKYLRKAKAARIVAECGTGKTLKALGTIHVLTEGHPSTTLVMCPSHITHKWAREVLLTTPRARTSLIEYVRNGGVRRLRVRRAGRRDFTGANSQVSPVEPMLVRSEGFARYSSICCELISVGRAATSPRAQWFLPCLRSGITERSRMRCWR